MTSRRPPPPFLVPFVLAGILTTAPDLEARPKLQTPALAVTHAGSTFIALSLTGSGFGMPGAGSYIEVRGWVGSVPTVQLVDAMDPDAVVWNDVHVVAKIRPDLSRLRARVVAAGVRTARVRADFYAYDWFDTSAALGSVANPTDPALEPDSGRIWIDPEFHSDFGYWDPSDEQVKAVLYPFASGGPFHVCYPSGCGQSAIPNFGEDVTLDTSGRVWFTEGGSEPTRDGGSRNHSRVVAYDRAGGTIRVYNLPSDLNSAIGVAWDEGRHRLWVAQTNPGRLTSFDPDAPGIPHEDFSWDFSTLPTCDPGGSGSTCSNAPAKSCASFLDCMPYTSFDFTTSATCLPGSPRGTCSNASYQSCVTVDDCVLADTICPPDVVDDGGCFHDYLLDIYEPAHIVVRPQDGSLWFTYYYLGNEIGRLDPATGEVRHFPMTAVPFAPPRAPFSALAKLPSWPWDIKVTPTGDVIAAEYAANRIAWFDASRVGDPACESLSAPGLTPEQCTGSIDYSTSPPTLVLWDSRCTNPCMKEYLVPGAWVPDSSNPPFTHVAVQALLTIDFDDRRNTWFDQGYLNASRRSFTLLPPLLGLYPTSFTAENPPDLHSGMGSGIVIDRSRGDIWGVDYLGRRLNRLHKTA